MTLSRPALALVTFTAALAATSAALAQDQWDDPAPGESPCVMLNSYDVAPRGRGEERTFGGEAALENLCGRSLEVSFCFLHPGDEEKDRSCYQGPVRPWASTTVVTQGASSRIVGPEYHWRYLPDESTVTNAAVD